MLKGFHDSKIVRNIDDLEEIENEKIPKTVQDTHRKHIEEWLINDKKFVETNASKNIAAALRSSNILFVVGRTGHGKTSVIRHAALNLSCKEGFEIIPDVADPNIITRFYQPGRKQIFVVDNIGGRDHINVKSVDLWSSSLQTIKLLVEDGLDCPGNTVCQHTKGLLKVLISCEKEIFDKTAFKDSNVLTDNICFLSDWEISVKERMEMIRKYSAIGDDFTNYNSFTDLEFPLLCRLTIGMSKSQIKAFFSNPLTHIRNEFENMQQNDKCKFFLITLCVVFQDGFAKDMINQCFQGNSTMLMNDLCNEFNFDTNNGKIHSRIMEKLNVLQQTYIHHENDRYSLIHKTIYTTAATVCGCRYFDFFISYGSCEFIGERYTLNAVTDKEDLIPIETEQKYFNRLLKDLEDGNTFSTFQNKQLDNHVYRHKFIDYFIKWGLKVREIMSKTNSFRRQSDELNNSKNSINITELSPLMQSAHKGYADVVLMLIELGCEINETDKDRRSPLYIAASCGRTEVVDVLLKNKADITLCDYMGRSPLYAASREGYDKIIEVLITVSEVDKCDDYGRFPLYVASEAGHIQVVELLLDNKAGISKTDKTGASPLFVATQRGQKRVVEYLVEKGADVNHCDNEGRSPLFVACEEKHTDLVKILLTHYAKQKFCDLHNRSPMYMASRAGNKEAVGLLLKENNNMINTYDDNGKTPLFVACELGHTDVVETILRYKPDVNLSNRLGLSPLHIACSKGHFKVIEILFLSRCDINKLDKDKRTPLYAACKAGHTDIVELLLDKKANFNICNKWGASVLFIACREGHLKVVECLLKTKPTMNRCNSNFSPLHKACEEGFEAIVKVLINKNSIINYRDENQKTPLHFACENGHANIVTLLRSLNAKSYKDIEGQLPIDLAKRNGHLSIVHLLED
ncbi:ankyrin-1-like [Mytilus edulis]|uniref:ankyrin-1-like n=1 Tax=Mytilus edulis TaxID=6550 RepID=UPI0039EEB24A